MAQIHRPSPVKLIIAILFTSEGVLLNAKEGLERKFGRIDFESPVIPFGYTDYYEKEMGPDLRRQFISFERLIKPDTLASIKRYTNKIESRLTGKNEKYSRRINLDPGYIDAARLVLATCKDYAHRVYLGGGIYAESTLQFKEGTFVPWPWTYPDYKSEQYISNFIKIRRLFLKPGA